MSLVSDTYGTYQAPRDRKDQKAKGSPLISTGKRGRDFCRIVWGLDALQRLSGQLAATPCCVAYPIACDGKKDRRSRSFRISSPCTASSSDRAPLSLRSGITCTPVTRVELAVALLNANAWWFSPLSTSRDANMAYSILVQDAGGRGGRQREAWQDGGCLSGGPCSTVVFERTGVWAAFRLQFQ